MSELTIPQQPTQSIPKVSVGASAPNPPSSKDVAGSVADNTVNANTEVATLATNGSNVSSDQLSGEQSGKSGELGATTLSSNIMTYRDSDSGRLVVRLVDKNNNAVISEFPSKTMLGNYPKPSSFLTETNTSLDTKA